MALTKAKKVELVDSYVDALAHSKSAVYLTFKGLSVAKQEMLRKKLFAENMRYTVVKKSLWERAVKSQNIAGEAPVITDELAIVWGDDLLAPARIANEFAKANKKLVNILGGIWDGNFKDSAQMLTIATIPTREVLLSQLAYLLKSPMQRIAIAVSEVAKKK
jgi:large subunit ribosomal protein L10